MVSSLSNIFDDLPEGIHKIKCKDCHCFPEYESIKDNLIKYKCLSYNIDNNNNNNDKFITLLRKLVYPYEYMNDWEKFNETTLPEKEECYSNLNTEGITGAD